MRNMTCLAAAASLAILAAALPAHAQDPLDPEATVTVKAMSDYLAGLNGFSVSTDIATDVMLKTGEKYRLASSGTVEMRRPGEVHVTRKGELADAEVFFDGKTFTVYGRGANAYFQAPFEGTTDKVIDELRARGFEVSGADLLYTNVYDGLMQGAWTATAGGTAWINGVECEHVTVRSEKVDWQIWVQTGEKRLPCMYVITSKWMTGAPEYSIRFSNWNTDPQFAENAFAFTPPEGATKVDELPKDETDQLANEKKTP